VAWLPGWLTAWLNAAGLLARVGWLAWADAAAADGVLGGGQAQAKAGAAARLPCCVSRGTATARARDRGGGYTRLCRATDQSALPRQWSAVMVAAT